MSGIDRDKWDKRYRDGAYAERTHPSEFLQDWVGKIPTGRAIDLACGSGRNALYLAKQGFDVDAVDISAPALDRAQKTAQGMGVSVNWLEHDLDEPLQLEDSYQLILIIRYVNLPLIRQMTANLAPNGFLVCEQHLETEAEVIGPTNAAYRVSSGDLLTVAEGLDIKHLEEVLVPDPDGRTAALARLVAQKP